jgi:hypothetical protein
MALQLARKPQILRAPTAARRPVRVVAKAAPQDEQPTNRIKQAALAGVVASALLLGSAVAPEEAFAARSGGRVSSSGFSSRRSMPRAAP